MSLLQLNHSGPSTGFFDRRYVNVTGDTMTGTLNIQVPTTTTEALILKTTDDDSTKNLFEALQSDGSTELFSITGDGKVRIGPGTPTAQLHVKGLSSTGPNIPSGWAQIVSGRFGVVSVDRAFYFDIQSTYAEFSTYNYFDNSTFPMAFQANGGNVGIGEVTPEARLHVKGVSASEEVSIFRAAPSQTANLTEWQDSSGSVLSAFDSAGNLGIGTGTPTSFASIDRFLHIASPLHAGIVFEDTAVSTKKFEMWTNGGIFNFKSQNTGRHVLTVADSGEIGFNTLSPADAAVQIDGVGGAMPILKLKGTASASFASIDVYGGSGVTFGNRFEFGQYDIAHANSLEVFFLNSASAAMSFSTAATERMKIGATGNVLVNGFTAPTVGLTVKAAASQTANLTEWQDSSGGVLSSVGYQGNFGIGVAPSDNYGVYINDTITATSGTYAAQRVDAIVSPTGSSSAGNIGSWLLAQILNTNSQNITVYLRGFWGQVNHNGGGTLAEASGVVGSVATQASSAGGAITNAYAIRALGLTDSGSGSIVNGYGLYVNSITEATTNNYAIYTNAGLNRLGDQLSVIGSQDTQQLIVKANSTQTANLTEWQNSSGGGLSVIDSDGWLGIGTSNPLVRLHVVEVKTDISGTQRASLVDLNINAGSNSAANFYGTQTLMQIDGTADYSGDLRALNFVANHRGTGTVDDLFGIYSLVSLADVAGSVAEMYGSYTKLNNNSSLGGVIGKAYGFYVETPIATGSITNLYGLYIRDQNVATNNYAIYTNAGVNRFGDAVHLKEITTPTAIADHGAVYPKTDNNLYFQDGAGTEKTLLDSEDTLKFDIPLTFYNEAPGRASEDNVLGGFTSLATTQPLNSVPTNIVVSKGTGKLIIVVNAGSDISGTITVTGEKIDRNTGASTPGHTNTITVDALTTDNSTTDSNGNIKHSFVGAYITDDWFTGTVTLSTTNLTLTDVDVYHVSFFQFNDKPNITLDSFDVSLYTTNVAAEFDGYLFSLQKETGNKCDIALEAELHVGADGETAIANKYWRLRRGNLASDIDGTTDGVWVDMHYSNSPAYVEDVTMIVNACRTVSMTIV